MSTSRDNAGQWWARIDDLLTDDCDTIADGAGDSYPRAIIEACVTALEAK